LPEQSACLPEKLDTHPVEHDHRIPGNTEPPPVLTARASVNQGQKLPGAIPFSSEDIQRPKVARQNDYPGLRSVVDVYEGVADNDPSNLVEPLLAVVPISSRCLAILASPP